MQAKRKLTVLLLSLCMLLGMLPMTAFAAGVPAAPTNLKLELTETGLKAAAVPGGAAPEADRGKTVGIIKKKIGIDPAVGFLVCVSGPHRGADYKLVAGRNFIGRAAAMDVALADDDTVSRESHALVTYDAKHNSFSLSPGQGRGITYCNDEQVEMVRPLKAYDVIEVGKSQLLFLPLCGEQFQWNEE